jgi:hypothetical protein
LTDTPVIARSTTIFAPSVTTPPSRGETKRRERGGGSVEVDVTVVDNDSVARTDETDSSGGRTKDEVIAVSESLSDFFVSAAKIKKQTR